MKVGGSCVSAGLVIGLSVGLALAVIALLSVFTLFQLRTIKQLKKQQAIDQYVSEIDIVHCAGR